MAAFAQDVRAVVEALSLKKVVLVGHSMSGNVVLEAAKAMPERVVGLIPVDTLLDVDQSRATPEEGASSSPPSAPTTKATATGFSRKYMFADRATPALRGHGHGATS